MRLFFKFASSILTYWGSFLTSGLIIGLLGFWQSTGHYVPPAVYWAIALLGFISATYHAWRDQHHQVEVAKEKEAVLQATIDAHKRQQFHAEFLDASRTVYTYENGNSPFVALFIRARVDNRNSEPTTVFVRRISVKLKDDVDTSFQHPSITLGGHFNFDNPEEYGNFNVAGSSSIELRFYTRRYNPPHIQEYIQSLPLRVTLELAETFGNHCELTGNLKLGSVEKNQ
jgi:hypothetical protein